MPETIARRELTVDHGRYIVDWGLHWVKYPTEHPIAIVAVNALGVIVGQGGTPELLAEATQRARSALAPGFDPEIEHGGRAINDCGGTWGAIGVAGRPGMHDPCAPNEFYEAHDYEIARAAWTQFVSPGCE